MAERDGLIKNQAIIRSLDDDNKSQSANVKSVEISRNFMTSMLVAYQLVGKKVLVIGENNEAASRTRHALEAGAVVSLVALQPCPACQDYVTAGRVVHIQREFVKEDLIGIDMVLACVDYYQSVEIAKLAKEYRIPLNCADIPELCDFYFMANYRSGPLQIAVSTNGGGPRMAAKIRDSFLDTMDPCVPDAVAAVAHLRELIRRSDDEKYAESSCSNPQILQAQKADRLKHRMQWIKQFCNQWSFAQLSALKNDSELLRVLNDYKTSKPPSLPPISSKMSIVGRTLSRYDLLKRTFSSQAPALGRIYSTQNLLQLSRSVITAFFAIFMYWINLILVITPRLPFLKSKEAKISLVGAGPGDPKLLTLAALEALQNCDLIVADRLVPQEVLALASARVILTLPKAGGKSVESQDNTNAVCLNALRQNLHVVRLKTGDPFVYGRGAEEIMFYRAHGYTPTVVPGLSSVIAGPGIFGIPLTHENADSFLVLSGRSKGGGLPSIPRFEPRRALVFIMVLNRLELICKNLIELDYPTDLACAIIERAGWRDQNIIRGTISTIHRAQKRDPALLVVGAAAGLNFIQ
jgi:uroporphyrin-III C-methyltransferase